MDWKDLVRTAAPLIGTALGGPAGGAALSFLGDKLLGKPNATEAEVAAHVRDMAPDQQIRLTQLQNDFKVAMGQQGIDLERLHIQAQQIEAQDRDSARNMQVQTRSLMVPALAILITIGFFSVLGLMIFKELPQQGRDALMIMLGTLGTAWGAVVAFYFGSSKGSADKTQAMMQAAARR